MTGSRQGYTKIAVFLIATFALSSIFYYLIATRGGMRGGAGILAFPLMWSPGVAALFTQLVFNRRLRGMGWGWAKTRYQLLAYATPLLYTAAVYFVIWGTGLVPASNEFLDRVARQFEDIGLTGLSSLQVLGIYLCLTLTLGMVINCLAALGEEIGWRGLLVPELAKATTYTKTVVISGLLWATWHYPLLLFGGYTNQGLPAWYALICFTVLVLGINFAMVWLRLKSGSLWTGVLFHASHNLFVQAVFTPLTAQTEASKYIIDEFGAGLALASLVVAFLFWRRRGNLTDVSVEPSAPPVPSRKLDAPAI